jgi:hypothetical protein
MIQKQQYNIYIKLKETYIAVGAPNPTIEPTKKITNPSTLHFQSNATNTKQITSQK